MTSLVGQRQNNNIIFYTCLYRFVRFYKKLCRFFIVMENIHENQVGEVLPYQFEPVAGAGTSNFSDESD